MRVDVEQRAAEAARALAKGEDGNWALARLTAEATLAPGRTAEQRAEGRVPMAEWTALVRAKAPGRRFAEVTGYRYRRVWLAHGATPAEERPPFLEAYAAVEGTPDRERMMNYEGKRLLEQGTVDQKADVLEALQQDKAVTDRVITRAIEAAEADRRAEQEAQGEAEAPEEPTASLAEYEARMREAFDRDVPTLYDRASGAWLKFMAAYGPEAVAEAIAASPHTASVAGYAQQAATMRLWLDRFEARLTAAQRPRLVPVQKEA